MFATEQVAALIAWMLVVRVGNLVKDGAKRRRLGRSSILDKIANTNTVLSKRSRPLSRPFPHESAYAGSAPWRGPFPLRSYPFRPVAVHDAACATALQGCRESADTPAYRGIAWGTSEAWQSG